MEREEQILLSLAKLDYLSRSQLQKLHDLGGNRNASRILKDLDEHLSHFRQGENIYYLNQSGMDRIGWDKQPRKKRLEAKHYLMRNDLYIAMNQPLSWKNEIKFHIPDIVTVIADAVFEKDGVLHIVEIDHTQQMVENRKKIEKYKAIRQYKDFKMIWVTTTTYRKKQLSKGCQGLRFKIYTSDELR
jgi:hypothetical protein